MPKLLKNKVILFRFKTFFIVFLVSVLLFGCAAMNKAKIGSILSQTQVTLTHITLDSLKANPKLFESTPAQFKLLPNPHIVSIVQELARGFIHENLGTVFISTYATVKLPTTEDSLEIQGIQATLLLDSLYELPISVKPTVIPNQNNQLSLQTELPIDSRLFSILKISEIRTRGMLYTALPHSTDTVSFSFDITKKLSDEEKSQILQTTRENLLKALVGDWVDALLSESKP